MKNRCFKKLSACDHYSLMTKERATPVTGILKFFLLLVLFLVQVFSLLITEQKTAFAAVYSKVTDTYRKQEDCCHVIVQAAAAKKSVRKISKSGVKLSKTSFRYDGRPKRPRITVYFAHKKLKKNRDYTVSYKNNIRRGTAKVIVRGTGRYRGTVTRTFKIK
jgi:hypothetical protein